LIEKFDFIILPRGFHEDLDDLISKNSQWFQSLADAIENYKLSTQTILAKYQVSKLKNSNPVNCTTVVGYGTFLNYCSKDTIIVGPPGSACIEALLNDLSYYTYITTEDPHPNKGYYNGLREMLFVASTVDEVIDNIKNKNIYKSGFSKKDVLYENGKSLHEIVEIILNDEKYT
jgi:hypothetical protein